MEAIERLIETRNLPEQLSGLKTIIQPESIIYRSAGEFVQVKPESEIKAGWFEYCKLAEIEEPNIVIWEPDLPSWSPRVERRRRLQNFMAKLANEMGIYTCFARLSGKDIQLYCYHPSVMNTTSPNMIAKSMGWRFSNRMAFGKRLKRMGILSIGEGAFAKQEYPYVLQIEDRPEADGALMISKGMACLLYTSPSPRDS